MAKPKTAQKKIKRLGDQIFRVRPSQVANMEKRIETLKNTKHRRR